VSDALPAAVKPSAGELEGAKIYACRLYGKLRRKAISRDEVDQRLALLPPVGRVLVRAELELLRQASQRRVYVVERTPEMWAELFTEWRLAQV